MYISRFPLRSLPTLFYPLCRKGKSLILANPPTDDIWRQRLISDVPFLPVVGPQIDQTDGDLGIFQGDRFLGVGVDDEVFAVRRDAGVAAAEPLFERTANSEPSWRNRQNRIVRPSARRFMIGCECPAIPDFLPSVLCKLRELPLIGSQKRQDDILLGNPHLRQFVGDTCFGAIVLNPNSVVLDVDVQHAAANPLVLVPSDVHQMVVLALVVDNRLHFHVAIERGGIAGSGTIQISSS